jgi:hypothetical protein
MSLGIECLVTDDEARAANCAQELDRLNRERRRIEAEMLEQARSAADAIADAPGAAVTPSMRRSFPCTVCLATESAGKFVSQMMRSSPCPIARKAYRTSAFSSGSSDLSTWTSRIIPRACPAKV